MPDPSKISAPDLTKRPPRSPHCRLGGYVILPRLLDKGRAVIAGTNGEFTYDAPLDQHLKDFLGLDFAALKEQIAAGKGDWEILEWVNTNAKYKRAPWEIDAWSTFVARRSTGSRSTSCCAGWISARRSAASSGSRTTSARRSRACCGP